MGTDSTSRTLILLAALALLAWGVWLVREVLPPFLIAFALALLLDPLLDRMQRWMPRGLAVALTFALFLASFIAVVLLLVPRLVGQIAELLRNIDGYSFRLQAAVEGWIAANGELLRRLNLPPTLPELWAQYQGVVSGSLQALLQRAFGALQASAGMLGWLLVVPIVTLYMLADLDPLKARLCHLVAASHREVVIDLSSKVGRVFAAYLRGLVMISAAFGVTLYVVLALGFRLHYSLLLGILAAILYAVPYLGQLTLLLLCCAVAWATGLAPGSIAGVGVAVVLVGQLFDQLITPRVIGKQVGLHPVLGLFALMVGAHLFGLAGMVVAVPVAASIRVVLIHLFPRLAEPLPEGREGIGAPSRPGAPGSGALAAVDAEAQPHLPLHQADD